MHTAVYESGGLLEVIAHGDAAAYELVGELDQLQAIQTVEAKFDSRREI
jgi:hypothetical protein